MGIVFETKDFQEIAVLAASDVSILQTRKEENTVFFVYEKTEALDKILSAYWRGELTINAKKFYTAVRETKYLIHKIQREEP